MWRARVRVGLVAACLALPLLVPGSAHAAPVKLSAGGSNTVLGLSLAVDGDTIVAGAPNRNTVYVFTRTDGEWDLTGTFSEGPTTDRFGESVAIDGETIVVGAPEHDNASGSASNVNQGAVYTFSRTGAPFRDPTAKLTAADRKHDDHLGWAVAIDGDMIVAGAPRDDLHGVDPNHHANEGSIYTFVGAGASWTQAAQLTASDHAPGGLFGSAVAIDGDTIVAGQYSADGAQQGQGAVYTFSRAGGDRTETRKLVAPGLTFRAGLGRSVDIDGDTIVAGAWGYGLTDETYASGAVYTFTRDGTWTGTLTAPAPVYYDQLGDSVAIEGDAIYAGAWGDDVDPALNQNEGSVEVFRRPAGGPWAWAESLRAADEAPQDQFGVEVEVDEGTLAVSVPGDDVGGAADAGSVWTQDDPVPVTLEVTKAGTGQGTVTSTPAGISCGPDCLRSYPRGSGVVLEARPAAGSVFAGFTGGGCSTSPCTVSMTHAQRVQATFNLAGASPDSAACAKARTKLEKASKKLKKLKKNDASESAIKKAKQKKKAAQAAVKDVC